MMKNSEKRQLEKWQERLDRSSAAYSAQLQKIDRREAQYSGSHELKPTTENDYKKGGKLRTTNHVWNITAENIEAMIDSTIPMPKVTPVRKKDERLARIIENMLRNEIDRLPFEQINDEGERTCKKQGGVGVMVEWDSTQNTHETSGANSVRLVHPKRIIPQDGVKDLRDMDYYFLLMPMTKKAVKERWGVDVDKEGEEKPEMRGEGAGRAEDMVTVKYAVYRNKDDSVGTYVWVNDIPLADMEDVQARRLRRCKKCGALELDNAIMLEEPSYNGEFPVGSEQRKPRKDECAYCGSRSWEETAEEERTVTLEELMGFGVKKEVIDALSAQYGPTVQPMATPGILPGMLPGMEQGLPGMLPEGGMLPEMPMEQEPVEQEIRIPYYKPDLYPMVMWINVTAYDTFLGESDCDKVADQQNTVNRMSQKILDRLVKAGTRIFLPADAHITSDSEDNVVQRITNMTDLALTKVVDFSGNLEYEFALIQQAYGEAQKELGITESFLGRNDPSAQSGKAKQFAAAQTAGRLESKRVLKKAAWADIYERMFKNMLAYADERRPVHFQNEQGATDYEEFNAWEFLDVDEAGELYWNDQFLFSCDDSSGLASNREAMWQETTAHFQSGAFGNPQDVNALIVYWTAMERLHYPGAGDIKTLLEEQRQQQMQQQAIMMQMQQQQAAMGMPMGAPQGMPQQGGNVR